MLKQSSSFRALCKALLLVAAITVQGLPMTRTGLVMAQSRTDHKNVATTTGPTGSAVTTPLQKTPAPKSPEAVAITATNRDAFPNHGDGKAHEGDTITYTLVVTNNGNTDATGVVFNDTVDLNTSTLVPGSPALSPVAVADTYSVLGNIRINTASIVGPGQHVTDNDSLTNGGAVSGFGNSQATVNGTVPNGSNTVTTANLGTVTMNADGSFSYNPGPGFTGADSFFYAVTSPTTGTGTAQVTLNVSSTIWFINNSGANGDGRLTSPFNSIANYNASAPTKDPNDIIFIYTGSGAYTGNLALLSGMQLIGQGVDLATGAGLTVPMGSDPLPTTISNPDIDSAAGDTVTLNLNNTIRGLNLRNSAGRDLVGSAFGTLTLSVVGLTGTGRPLDLNNGALAATFTGITSTSSSGGQGIILTSVAGNMIVTGGTSITNPASQGILVTASTANLNFGNTTISGGTNGVSLQNNSAGTRTFGTLSLSNGTGAGNPAFLHANGGGLTVAGTTTITNPAGTGIDIQSSSTLITFGVTTVNKGATAGIGVNLGGTGTGNSGGVTFSSLDITTSNGSGLVGTENSGTIIVTNSAGSISAINGPAINITKPTTATPISLAFANVSSNSSTTQGINLLRVSGSLTTTGGMLTGAAASTFSVNTSTANVTYPGSITQATSGQRVVDIQNNTSGAITLSGTVTSNNGLGTGVILNNNSGATINFTGGINLSTGANDALTATGGGTVSATQNNTTIVNTLTNTTGVALKVTNTTISASGLTFRSISSNGGTSNGITLDTTGSNGGLTIIGNSGAGTGGTIQNKVGADGNSTQGIAIYLNSTSSVSLALMSIQGNQNYGIRANNVTGFALDNSTVGTTSTNGTSNTADADPTGYVGEGSLRFYNLLGSATISNSSLDQGFAKTIAVANDTGTLNRLTITNSTVKQSLIASTASDSFYAQSSSNATLNFTITGASQFTATHQFHVDTSAQGTSTMDIQINGGCVFSNSMNPVPAGGGLQLGGSGTDTLVTFNITGNSFRHGTGASSPGTNNVGRLLTAGMVSGNGKFDGKITNNTFGVTGIARTGSGDGADAIGLFASGNQAGSTRGTGTRDSRFLVQGNTIKRYGQTGVQINARQGNSILDATVFGNTINEPGAAAQGAFAAVWVNAGALPPDTNRVDVVIGDASVVANKNTMQDSDPNNATDVFLDKNSCAGCGSTLNLYRNGSGAGGSGEALVRQIFIDDNNPSLDLLAGFTNGSTIGILNGLPPQPAFAQPGPDSIALSRSDEPQLPTALAQPPRWTNSGSVQIASLNNIEAQRETQKRENRENKARTYSTSAASSIQRGDVASTESRAQVNRNLPFKALSVEPFSNRSRDVRLNHAVKQESSKAKPNGPLSGGQVTINVGTLSAGSSVTITFQVTVNTAAPAGASQISNQGTVSGSNFASVVTDDPDTPAPNDPTITPLLHPSAADGIVSGRILCEDGTPVEGAVVSLNGSQSRKTITDADGNYHFDNVETGGFYTVTPSRVNYNFNPFNRSFSQLANKTEATFTGLSTGDNVNPLDTAEYFVRQQYLDILGREPDEGGFNYWSDRILECNADLLCANGHRRDVAAAFFIEQEFQQTGSFIYNVYKGALGRKPVFGEYGADRRQVIGGASVDAEKTVFSQAFVQRAEFGAKYLPYTTAQSFVDAFLGNVQQASGVDLSGQRDTLVTRYNAGANQIESRGLVLRDVAESSALRQAEYNSAFVLTEYFGYLRRDPDAAGFAYWLEVLNNQETGNFRGMVCAFVTSTEYQKRFSQVVSRSNADCGQ